MIEFSFELGAQQSELLNVRLKRKFYKLCQEAKLHSLINSAICESELAAIIKKYGLSDVCDFSGLHISVAKRLTDCVVTALYMYPKLRSRICFIGSKKGYMNALSKLSAYDGEFIKSLGVQYVLSEASAAKIGQVVADLLNDDKDEWDGQNTLAHAMYVCGVLDGIILDDKDFGKNDILQIKLKLKMDALVSHSPKDCASIESVIYHEIGHLLDYLCDVSKDKRLSCEYSSISKLEIKKSLSEYAAISIEEYIAEGFSEYMSTSSPRAAAKRIKEAIDRRYLSLLA